MSNSLNAIFRPNSEPEKRETPPKLEKRDLVASVKTQVVTKELPKRRLRKQRVDKKKDIKFPVTPEQREELRRLASDLRIQDRKPELKYETISNTVVLKKAMDQFAIFPERYPPLLYKDSGQYMHAEPLLGDYEQIEELARRLNLSIRKTVYRLIMNFIFRGDVDIDAYRKSQQK